LSKKRSGFKRFFLQPLMPRFHNSEHYYEKRYKMSLTLLFYTAHLKRARKNF